jgi:hypothetical protein
MRWFIRTASLAAVVARVALLCSPEAARAQATPNVSVQDPVYRDLERLFGAGLIETMLVGQRPHSRREIARIVAHAAARRSSTTMAAVHTELLERLAAEYAPEIARLAGDSAALPRVDVRLFAEMLGTNSQPRAIPSDPSGSIDADIDPLLGGRGGRTYRPGLNVALESRLTLRPADWLVLAGDVRGLESFNGGRQFAAGELLAGSASFLARNVALEIGRQQFVWGQGMDGGLLGSTSGRALDMLRLATDTPFFAPWFLHRLGPMRASVVIADLGPNQHFPHSNLVAYKMSGNPFTWRVELSGFGLAEHGGRGAPSASFMDHVLDDIPILGYALGVNHRVEEQISNKMAGAEYRVRIPEWSGLQIYAEHILDDADPRRWGSTFWEDAGHLAGVSLARLGSEERLSAAAEYRHTGIRFYKHGMFKSGLTFNRTLIGDPLGNQGDGGYLRLTWDATRTTRWTLNAALERRGGDEYDARVDGSGANQTNFRFVLVTAKPAERRKRIALSFDHRPGLGIRHSIEAGAESVGNAAFVQNAHRVNGFVRTAFEWSPR